MISFDSAPKSISFNYIVLLDGFGMGQLIEFAFFSHMVLCDCSTIIDVVSQKRNFFLIIHYFMLISKLDFFYPGYGLQVFMTQELHDSYFNL